MSITHSKSSAKAKAAPSKQTTRDQEICKADEWITEINERFNCLLLSLVEMVLADKLYQGTQDAAGKCYFLINFEYYSGHIISEMYSFWNMVAQYLNVFYGDKKEGDVTCGLFSSLQNNQNDFVKKICGLYFNELNGDIDITKLRRCSVHRIRIPITELGPKFYMLNTGLRSWYVRYNSNSVIGLENKIMETMKKLVGVVEYCVDILEMEIKSKGCSNITMVRGK